VMCDHCSKWRSLPPGYKVSTLFVDNLRVVELLHNLRNYVSCTELQAVILNGVPSSAIPSIC
jgi:hypothetical protein